MHVEHDDVDALEPLTRLANRRRLADVPTVELEVEPAEHPNGRVVVDDEHGAAGRIHSGPQSSRAVTRSFDAPFTI